jgi:hypothetical protein
MVGWVLPVGGGAFGLVSADVATVCVDLTSVIGIGIPSAMRRTRAKDVS